MEQTGKRTEKLMQFAERFNKLRGDMTQAQFAEFLGISRPTIGFYENGTRLPDAFVLKQIAQKCNVSSDYLLGLTDAPTNDKDLQFVSDYTGLSVEAIEVIQRLQSRCDCTNNIVVAKDFSKLILCASIYEQLVQRATNLLGSPVDENDFDCVSERFDSLADVRRKIRYEEFNITEIFIKMFRETFKPTELDENFETKQTNLSKIIFHSFKNRIGFENESEGE